MELPVCRPSVALEALRDSPRRLESNPRLTMSAPKLTKPQMELLREMIASNRTMFINEFSDSALRLVELRLARWGGYFQNKLIPTDKGRELNHTLTTAEETKLSQCGFTSEGGAREPI